MKYIFTFICLVVLSFAWYQVLSQSSHKHISLPEEIVLSSEDQEILDIKASIQEDWENDKNIWTHTEEEKRNNISLDPIKIEQKKEIFEKRGDFYSYKQFEDSALESYQIAFVLSEKSDTDIAQKIANIQ